MTMQQDNRTPCRCWGCRRELATTDGASLYFDERVSIRRPITLWCVCGGATYWRPSKTVRCERETERLTVLT